MTTYGTFSIDSVPAPSDLDLATDVLVFDQCPLCDRYAGWIEHRAGGRFGHGLVFRYDLAGFVCTDCDYELGPDEGRIKCLMLGGRTRAQAIELLYATPQVGGE